MRILHPLQFLDGCKGVLPSPFINIPHELLNVHYCRTASSRPIRPFTEGHVKIGSQCGDALLDDRKAGNHGTDGEQSIDKTMWCAQPP